MQKKWLELYDEEVTADQLMTTIEKRVQQRQAAQGEIKRTFPTFGFIAPMPHPPAEGDYSATLYHHLQRLNEMETAETTPLLVPSPNTRLPLLGPLWQLIRRAAHELVLFYVNRHIAHNTTFHNHLINILNEQTNLLQAQQQEIEKLQLEIQTLREGGESRVASDE
jgi:hypothetical protein